MAIDYFKKYDDWQTRAVDDVDIMEAQRENQKKKQEEEQRKAEEQNRRAEEQARRQSIVDLSMRRQYVPPPSNLAPPGQSNGPMRTERNPVQPAPAPSAGQKKQQQQNIDLSMRRQYVPPPSNLAPPGQSNGPMRTERNPARPSARGFVDAAQNQQAQGGLQPVSKIQQIDQRAEAEAKAQKEKREQAMRDANMSLGEAFSEALRKFRDDSTAIVRNGRERVIEKDANGRELVPGVNGYEAKYKDSENRYRIGMLQPATIRSLNQQRSALGLKQSDSIVGIYAVSGVDANGKTTGEPLFIIRYRSADGRIHQKVYTYQEAARFVRGTMGEKGDAGADDKFASMKQWQDADGNDALGITRTAEYQERRAKLDAERQKNETAALKNEQMKTQIENEPIDALAKKQDRLYALHDKITDPAMKDKIADSILELNKQIETAEKSLADKKSAEERRAEAARAKPGDNVSFEPNAVWGKNGTLVPKPGFVEENGKFVPVKPQKPGTPQATQSADGATSPKPEATVGQSAQGTNQAQPTTAGNGASETGKSNKNELPANEQTSAKPGTIAEQASQLDILGKIGRAVKGAVKSAVKSVGEGYQTGEQGSEPAVRYDIESERKAQDAKKEQSYNKRVSSARLRRQEQDAKDRARIERDKEQNERTVERQMKSQKEREAEWKAREKKIASVKDAETRKRLKKQSDAMKKRQMELYSSGDTDAIRRYEQEVEELESLLADVVG